MQVITPDLRDLLRPDKATVHNRTAQLMREGTRDVLKLDARPRHGLAWWHDLTFETGTISLELRGKNELQRSFVGFAFHGARDTVDAADAATASTASTASDQVPADGLSYEAVYFRPFNFRSEDPQRRLHMVQYAFPAEGHWRPLREQYPGRYEQPVHPVSDPDDWFSARIEVAQRTVRVFVSGSDTPSLTVDRLTDRRDGWCGLWVGNGSDGAFASLTLSPAAS